MIFLSCQPHDPYFQWMIEVQIVNFRKFGISENMHILVWHSGDRHLPAWKKIQEKYPEVSIFFYQNQGAKVSTYIPVVRPHAAKQHFARFPELSKETIFYHDGDIIFNYLPDFQLLGEDDINWQSDCSGYMDYNYLRKKEIEGNIPENEAIQIIVDIGNISIDCLKSYIGKTGGAQCLLKDITFQFWEDVERMCVQIREKFDWNRKDSINRKYFPSENDGFQSWCADMWALNMALWSRNKVTNITPLLDFSWATNNYETFLKKPIYHNSGATRKTPELFYKGAWINKSPLHQQLTVKQGTASEQYVKAIYEVK